MFKRDLALGRAGGDVRARAPRRCRARSRYAELARTLGVRPGERAPLAERARGGARPAARQGDGARPGRPRLGLRRLVLHQPDPHSDDFSALEERAERPPRFPEPDGRVKTSAAWLIERAGFQRGHGNPEGIAISTKHTLALTNRGGGTTAELLALAREIAAGVEARFGVRLEPEPTLVGVDWP